MKTVQKTLNQLVVGSNPTGVTIPPFAKSSSVSPDMAKSGGVVVPSPLSHGGDHA